MLARLLSLFGVVFLLFGCGKLGPKGPELAAVQAPLRPGLSDGWISSGGELLRDARNPWWLRNTKEVSYCILIDAASVTAEEKTIDQAFLAAVNYWQTEFQTVESFLRDYGKESQPSNLSVATQTFKKVDCSDATDLKILVGYGALDAEGRAFMPKPQGYASFVVRTHYDRVNLRGKGFIYLGSDAGPSRFDQKTYPHPWKLGFLLVHTLAHEVGHLFGVPHVEDGNYDPTVVMAENYVESLFAELNHFRPNREPYFPLEPLDAGTLPEFMNPLKGSLGHFDLHFHVESRFGRFFELDPKQFSQQIALSWRKSLDHPEWPRIEKLELVKAVHTKRADDTFDTSWETLGEIADLRVDPRPKPLVWIYLTKEERVFNKLPTEQTVDSLRVMGPQLIELVGQGNLVLKNGSKAKPIYFEIPIAGEIRLFGEIDGKLNQLYSWKGQESPLYNP